MKFTLNSSGVDELVRERDVIDHLERIGKQIASEVEQRAPVDTGDFRDSIEVLPAEMTMRGPVVTVHSTDFAAHMVEFGSVNNPVYAPFRKAANALGLPLKGGGERK